MEEAARLLADFPFAGRDAGRNLRRWAVPRTPYVIMYRLSKGALHIAAVLHAKRER
jgi:plasmid stabilization system protein ParE